MELQQIKAEMEAAQALAQGRAELEAAQVQAAQARAARQSRQAEQQVSITLHCGIQTGQREYSQPRTSN